MRDNNKRKQTNEQNNKKQNAKKQIEKEKKKEEQKKICRVPSSRDVTERAKETAPLHTTSNRVD